MVLAVATAAKDESLRTESGSLSTRRIPLYCRTFEIGLPEVDKLFAESQKIIDPGINSMASTRIWDGDKDMEDHISELPNDILQFIISLLTTREGAATSILSTRWRNIWSTSASCLNFDDSNLLGYKCASNINMDRHLSYESRGNMLSRADVMAFYEGIMTTFISRADNICQLRRASKMDIFRVSFPFYDDSSGHIDRWMELAASQGVTKLILDFGWHNITRFYSGKYKFPVQIFGSSLKYLVMDSCTLQFPPNFHGLNSLTTLTLSECILTDKDVHNFMSSCHSLQLLSFNCCYFPDHTSLKFVGPTIPLKHLHISNCNNVTEVSVCNMNLLSFELIEEEPVKLSIENVPHLARLVLDMDEPVEILGDLPRLETLVFVHEEGELPKLSALSNLKRLVFADDGLRSNLFEVVCFLEACPLLQQLELDLRFCGSELDRENDADLEGPSSDYEGLSSAMGSRNRFSLHNLKEVHIYGFDSHPEIVELAKYLLEYAVLLEKMIMYRNSKSYLCNGSYLLSREFVKIVGMSLEDVLELFRKVAHASTELLIV